MNHEQHPEEDGYSMHQQLQTAAVMDQFGSDLAEAGGLSQQRRREQRIKRGECPTCRRKTHKVSRFPFGNTRREPLTVEGEVLNGHCLRCKPAQGYTTRGVHATAIPETLEVPDRTGVEFAIEDDAGTVASELTLDPFLAESSSFRQYSNRPHMASRFESVTEEEETSIALTELENERKAIEREIVRQQEDARRHVQQGERHRGGIERTSESEGEWENYDHLLRQTDPEPEPIPQQSFHTINDERRRSSLSDTNRSTPKRLSSSFNIGGVGGAAANGGGPNEAVDESSSSLSGNNGPSTRRPLGQHPRAPTYAPEKFGHSMSTNDISARDPLDSANHALTDFSSSETTMGKRTPDSKATSDELSEDRLYDKASSSLSRGSSAREETLRQRRKSASTNRRASQHPRAPTYAPDKFGHSMSTNDISARDPLDSANHALTDFSSSEATTIKQSDDSNATSDELSEDRLYNKASSSLSRGSSAREETLRQRRKSASTNRRASQLSTIEDIPLILKAVQSSRSQDTLRAFQSLFLLATDPEPEGSLAKTEILANGGMETLSAAIWDHMENSEVLLALFHALWAISAVNSKDEKSNKASVAKMQECRVVEGLLFGMQTHANDSSIQEAGCDLISRLTGSLPADTPEFRSAVPLLSSNIQSMDTESKAYLSCLDALNSLCQLNDANKVEFAKAGSDCHSAVIRGFMHTEPGSAEAKELACQLFWCATSDRAAVSALSSDDVLAKSLIEAMNASIIDAMNATKSASNPTATVQFYGAASGTLANLALEPDNHGKLLDLGVVPALCEAIYEYDSFADVTSAACTALANLSASRNIRDDIVSQGAIAPLFTAMKATEDNIDVQSEALRALHNLCESSKEGKRAIAADLDTVISAFFQHEGGRYIQQVICSILFRLSTDERCRETMMDLPKMFVALAKIMKEGNPRKKLVQKSACSALRNLSLEEPIIPTLRSLRFDSLVIEAMNAYPDSEELQESACTFLLNLGCSSLEASEEICSVGGIEAIVAAMRTIPTSASLQQASCGALSALMKEDAHKSIAASAGAIDAVICLIVTHLDQVEVLENAVQVMANLSSVQQCTKTIADAGGISTVVELMKAHPCSLELIHSASEFLRNMALVDPEYANEACGAISPILNCMEEHPDNARLKEEACHALHSLVQKSENCKDQVLSANGVAVIENTLKGNGSSERWQTILLDELFE
ncbi:hypothetical protein ACHAXT_006875 [Thalassiosira profunda]